MKRYLISLLVIALLGIQSLFGFGGGFTLFPGLGDSFPSFNTPSGTGTSESSSEKSVEFTLLAGYSGTFHITKYEGTYGSGVTSGSPIRMAFSPSVQLRFTVNRFQFMVDGTWNEFLVKEGSIPKIFAIYGGAGYQLVNNPKFSFSTSVVGGYRSVWLRRNVSSSSSYNSYSNNYIYEDDSGFLFGVDLLAMLRLGKNLGLYANGLISFGGIGAKLGIAFNI